MKTITTFKNKRLPIFLGTIALILGWMNPNVINGQDWPVSFEGAPALKPAQLEISLYGAGSYLHSSVGKGTIGYTPGIKIGIGIVDHFDVKLAYSRGFYKDYNDKLSDSKVNNISIMPKVSFLKGHLAFQLPFTVMVFNADYNEESKTEVFYLLCPRMIGSLRFKEIVEFNFSPFFETFIPGHGNDPSYFIGGNVGVSLSSNLQRWSIRPEGFMSYFFPHNNSENYKIYYYGWGLAFTYNIDFNKHKQELPEK